VRILLSNDDGIEAPGLAALIEALAPRADLFVVAPDSQRSACSLAITLGAPLRAARVPSLDGVVAYRCSGYPADCVCLAVYALAEKPFDLVISGINDGPNLGEDISHSGTVGAAIEASMLGLPAVAISALRPMDGSPTDFRAAAHVATRLVEAATQGLYPAGDVVLNVNVPALPREQLAGVCLTRQGRRRYKPDVRVRGSDNGEVDYDIYGGPSDPDPPADTDIGATQLGWVSITPISHRMTARSTLEALRTTGIEGML
jgi:5'-nucleotidase